MKELTMYIKPEKLEVVKNILQKLGCGGMSVMSIMGCGIQLGETNAVDFKGLRTNINLIPKIKIEAVVKDELVEDILLEIRDKVATGTVGDGKVIVKNVEDVMRIRTGERGTDAI
ncbi:MAG: transcriptional regulator [Anaerocolumna sp.]|jgi:nitrogen regulatory protein P-II 1|nr:transcriptional regulator [Anaerocolumna sp.]